jgi:hypothetical protein
MNVDHRANNKKNEEEEVFDYASFGDHRECRRDCEVK